MTQLDCRNTILGTLILCKVYLTLSLVNYLKKIQIESNTKIYVLVTDKLCSVKSTLTFYGQHARDLYKLAYCQISRTEQGHIRQKFLSNFKLQKHQWQSVSSNLNEEHKSIKN